MSRIFINYRRQDSEGYVGRLYDRLVQHFEPDDIFMDISSIAPGADFVQVLEDAVAACDVFISIIGPQWLTAVDERGQRRLEQWNDFVRIELASALKQSKLVIPVLVGQARMPSPTDLPEDLAPVCRRNAIELSHHRFAYDMDKLIASLKTAVPANESFKLRSAPDVVLQKEEALKALRLDLVNATGSPLYRFRTENRLFPVLGEGNPDANIMFIGESPGKTEAETGRPFCGPSGEILDEMLQAINLKREHVYLTNLVLDRPPEKRAPTPDEIAFYGPFVDRLIEIIEPAVLATLGGPATQYVLRKFGAAERGATISQVHGKLIKAQTGYGEIHLVPLFHPAVVLYTPAKKDALRRDFERLKLFI